jgi:serine/threonine-protein kinase
MLVHFVPRLIVGASIIEILSSTNSVIAAVSVALGLLVFVLSRNANIAAKQILNLGLVFEVAGALGIAMSEFWGIFPDWSPQLFLTSYYGIPWECVWIIGFPLLAPNTPNKTLVASLAAASAGPLTVLASWTFGPGVPDVPLYFFAGYFLFTTYLCAGIAYLISLNILKFGARLSRAREVGAYSLIELLGEGGMGEVWAGSHRMLARPAAVKLIRPELLGASEKSREIAVKRFEREAKATAALTCCHTVAVYDFGITEDGAFFYVMEMLNGLSLEALVKRFGPVRAARTCHFLHQICNSLSEAHENGLIHRDIKPANVFACRLGTAHDFVKVLDFGLVKAARPVDSQPQLTGEGIAAGTPAYMAPEMALEKADVDERADIYSVGCVAYWLLTGQQVFEADSPVATIVEHVQSAPVPPSQRTELEIPAALDELVMACLEKDPADRPQSAGAIIERLCSCVDGDAWDAGAAEDWWRVHLPEHVARMPELPPDLSPQGGIMRVRY